MPSASRLPGFRDFYPAELSARTHITNAWREVSQRYGFEEYDGPPLEPLEIYSQKSGDEIVGQLYNFVDKGERAVALRPEMTPTVARMVGARAGALRKPIRWFSIPQLFRYERTQRGRLREHFQWNADIIGEEDMGADAEVLALALDGLRRLGLGSEDIVARYNDRRLLEKLLIHTGVAADALGPAYAAVDKLGREPEERVRQRLMDVGLDASATDRVFQLFRVREPSELAGAFAGVADVDEELDRLDTYAKHLARLGLGEFVAFDPTIVRGLAYYTGTVFEIFDRKGELRAICGGGRYDDLLRSVSDVDLPAAGFGMGDVVIGELLRERGLLPEYSPGVDYFVVAVSEAEEPLQRWIAARLRSRGSSVLYSFRRSSVGRQFKEADARGARQVIVLGPEEVAEGMALVREMQTGEERRVAIAEI